MSANRRSRRAASLLLFLLAGLLVIWTISDTAAAWARPGNAPAHQTVPTMPPKTPTPSPAPARPSVAPSATPSPAGAAGPTTPATVATVALPAPTMPAGSVSLRVELRASQTAVQAGQSFQYVVTIQNVGMGDAGPLTVRDVLPAGVQLLAARASAGQASVVDNAMTVQAASLPPGAVLQVELDARVRPMTAPGTVFENVCEVEAGGNLWRSPPALVALPPAELPRVGGRRPAGPA
jgi:uncharacterized repeat protein (TIGR01451 family)